MNAGRELDALVAEKVMGWRDVTDRRHNDGKWTGLYDVDDSHSVIDDLPYYSIDISAAWQVVSRMRALGYELDLHHKHLNCYGKPDPRCTHTHAIFRGNTRDKTHDGGALETDPAHAICRAALRACGVVTVEAPT